MALRLSTGLRSGMAGTLGLATILQGGCLDIYSGGQPASADYAETGSKLVRITVGSGDLATAGLAFTAATLGVLAKNVSSWSGVVSAAGVAGYFRFYCTAGTSGSSATDRRVDGNIGVSGADMVLANTSLVAGATLTIDTFSLEVPSA